MRPSTLVSTSTAVATTALVGASAVEPEGSWYRQLNQPSWQPPPSVFPPVWTALYADIALSSALALSGRAKRGDYTRALALNLALNAGWSWVFWRARRPGWAAVEAAALTASSADLAARTARVHCRAGVALVPYVAWCSFATVLSTAIAWRNRRTQR